MRLLGAIAAVVLGLANEHLTGEEVLTKPLPFQPVPAFENVTWEGWEAQPESGQAVPMRPILVTHAGDGSGRIFIPTQHGVIYVLDSRDDTSAEIFLDIRSKVSYSDATNEEGFLGLAFHPQFKENGQFFVYYTNKHTPHQNVVARFEAKPGSSAKADPESEQILLTINKPFWNHDGGTVVFGPDGYLYIAVGDGGAANDPFKNGQKLSTLLGKILRIDVNRKDEGLAYAIPKDNPFVGRKDARPEVWAYGLRNVWRMAFDRETGKLWAGDVGQDLWEEIDIIVRGGNYGWSIREGKHPFGKNGVEAREDLIEPIWEYHHDVGKSITGGLVYRGSQLAELVGAYLYADYVSGKIWALRFDESTGRVVANQEIPSPMNLPVMSFGEDQDGEVYLTTVSATGRGIYTLRRTGAGEKAPAASK